MHEGKGTSKAKLARGQCPTSAFGKATVVALSLFLATLAVVGLMKYTVQSVLPAYALVATVFARSEETVPVWNTQRERELNQERV